MKDRRDKRREKAKGYLGNKCVVCGSNQDLEFDHIIPENKTFQISSAKALDGPWASLEEELNKCQLLCHEHHLIKTSIENSKKIPWNLVESPSHGTAIMYGRLKCRCDICKEWKRNYRSKLVDSSGNTR